MTTREDIEYLKYSIQELDNAFTEWELPDDDDIDYEDLKKRIFDIQRRIKSFCENWEE